jgi:hypothetical protein
MFVRIGRYANEEDSEDFEREVDVVIHNYDTWSMDETLAHIIIPMLKQLKKTKHGAPKVDSIDVPMSLKPSLYDVAKYNEDGTTDDKFFKRWDWVMDEMIFAFESKLNDWEDKYHTGNSDIKFEPVGPAQLRLFPDEDGKTEEHKFYEMVRGPNDTAKFDKEGYIKEAERIENGFRLFGKYYQSLWD